MDGVHLFYISVYVVKLSINCDTHFMLIQTKYCLATLYNTTTNISNNSDAISSKIKYNLHKIGIRLM